MANALIYRVIAQKKGLPLSELEKKLGMGNGTIGKAIERMSTVRKPVLDKLSREFPDIDITQLQVDLLNEVDSTADARTSTAGGKSSVNEDIPLPNADNNQSFAKGRKKVPVFDTVAMAGNEHEADLAPVTIPTQYIELGDMLRSDSQAALYIFGNSMTPNYPPGCVVGLRLNLDGVIQQGEVYVIETDSNRLLKRLYYSEDGTGYELYSDNTMTFEIGPKKGKFMYPISHVKFENVRRLFDVTGVIKRNSNSAIMQRA